jgi:hypothetical protein
VANSKITQSQFFRRFGSVSAALKLAGVEQASHGRRHTENDVFENLLEVWTHCGRPPTASEMGRPPSSVGKNTYIKRYGGGEEHWRPFWSAPTRKSMPALRLMLNKALPRWPIKAVQRRVAQPVLPVRQGHSLQVKLAGFLAPQGACRPTSNPRTVAIPVLGLSSRCSSVTSFIASFAAAAQPLSWAAYCTSTTLFSKGGKTTLENLQALCLQCNVGKSNRGRTAADLVSFVSDAISRK